MQNFTFYAPTKIIFGRGTIPQIGEALGADGISRVVLVAGGGSIYKNGVHEAVTGSLEKHGIRFAEERYGSIGPLGRLARDRYYPKAERPCPDGPRYDNIGRPAEDAFNLQDPVQNTRPNRKVPGAAAAEPVMPLPDVTPERIPLPPAGN